MKYEVKLKWFNAAESRDHAKWFEVEAESEGEAKQKAISLKADECPNATAVNITIVKD